MAEEFGNIGNYKGLMLCSRPDQQVKVQKQREFISRVTPYQQIGYTPVTKPYQDQNKKRKKHVNIALLKHRLWLQNLQKSVKQRDQEAHMKMHQQQLKQHRIRETSLKNIQNMKVQSAVRKQILQSKPLWAMSEAENEAREDREIESVLDFFNPSQSYEGLVQDIQVKVLLKILKQRFEDLKKHPQKYIDLKNKIPEEETKSKASTVQSHKHTLPSKPLQHSLKDRPEWEDNSHKSQNFEKKVVRHLVNEIMRQNNYLKQIHSKRSIERLLEGQVQGFLHRQVGLKKWT